MKYLQYQQKTKILIKYQPDLQIGWLIPKIRKLVTYMILTIFVMNQLIQVVKIFVEIINYKMIKVFILTHT